MLDTLMERLDVLMKRNPCWPMFVVCASVTLSAVFLVYVPLILVAFAEKEARHRALAGADWLRDRVM